MNVKPILLATDGSPSAAEATLEAVELAKAFDAPLVVISVEHPPLLAGTGFYGYGELLGEIRKVENERIEAALSQTMAVAAEAGVACEGIHGGDEASVADQICRLAAARKARMIVVGAHGWGADAPRAAWERLDCRRAPGALPGARRSVRSDPEPRIGDATGRSRPRRTRDVSAGLR